MEGVKTTKPGSCVAADLVAKSCLTLRNLTDCSSPGSSVHGISQAGRLEWVTISFPRRSSQPRGQTRISCIARRFVTLNLGPSGSDGCNVKTAQGDCSVGSKSLRNFIGQTGDRQSEFGLISRIFHLMFSAVVRSPSGGGNREEL